MPKPAEKKLPKHHYIPVFYLKQWTNGNGRLCEYSKPYKQVKPRRTSPKGTGYVRGLYRLPNVPDDKAELVETIYMQVVDDGASAALRVLLDDKATIAQMTDRMKTDWARFLHCLILRNPEYISAMSALLARDVGGYVEAVKDQYVRTMAALIDAARFIHDLKNIDRVAADAVVTGHTAAVSKATIKPLLDIDYWPVDNDGLDRPRLERLIALMKEVGGIRPDKEPINYDQLVDQNV